MTARVFLAYQLEELAKTYDVTIFANLLGNTDIHSWLPEAVSIIDVPIHRTIKPWSDVRCFFELKRLFKKHRFALVHSVSPKAGLISMLAARAAKVPIRIHTFTGQVWATKKGLTLDWMLRAMDRVHQLFCATTVLVDSFTQRGIF